MKTAIAAVCLVAGVLAGAADSHAGYVIDFETLAHSDELVADHGATYLDNGYLFTNTATFEDSGYSPSFATLGSQVYGYSGSTALLNNNYVGQTVLARTNGGTFNLSSITLATLYPMDTPDNTPVSVQFNGHLANGNTVTQSFTVNGDFTAQTFTFGSDFSNLVSADWLQSDYAYQFDNVDVTATPVPAAAWLLGSGLLGLVGLRRREKQQ